MLVLVQQQLLDIGQHVESAVMVVGLARQLSLETIYEELIDRKVGSRHWNVDLLLVQKLLS
jgi:hypothetical protein